MSVEFKARLPLSEQEMCCGYDDLAGPLPETRSARPQLLLLLLPPPAGHFTSSPRVSSRACQRTRPAGKRAASARLGLYLRSSQRHFLLAGWTGRAQRLASPCGVLDCGRRLRIVCRFCVVQIFFIYAPIGGRW